MYVVFRTTQSETDEYHIEENPWDAERKYKKWSLDQDTYCAGWAPIQESTDWTCPSKTTTLLYNISEQLGGEGK